MSQNEVGIIIKIFYQVTIKVKGIFLNVLKFISFALFDHTVFNLQISLHAQSPIYSSTWTFYIF